jgi:hypothetical protein
MSHLNQKKFNIRINIYERSIYFLFTQHVTDEIFKIPSFNTKYVQVIVENSSVVYVYLQENVSLIDSPRFDNGNALSP